MYEMQLERSGPIASLRLNRPDQRNALSLALIAELTEAVEALSAEASLRVIVLSGKGPHFCAGADIGWMRASADLDEVENRHEAATLARLFAALDGSPKAVIGDIGGAAIGGGAGLVALCDYAIASDDAFFRFSEVRLGLLPAVISPYVLAKLGPSATRAAFTSGEGFNAARARELGLVHEVVTPTEREAAVERMTSAYLACAPGAVAETKALLRRLVHAPPAGPAEVIALTIEALAARRVTPEARQGLAAFLAHETPPWLL